MKSTQNTLFQGDQVKSALRESFIKLDPRILVRNPVMFTVEIGTVVMLIVPCIRLPIKARVTSVTTLRYF